MYLLKKLQNRYALYKRLKELEKKRKLQMLKNALFQFLLDLNDNDLTTVTEINEQVERLIKRRIKNDIDLHREYRNLVHHKAISNYNRLQEV